MILVPGLHEAFARDATVLRSTYLGGPGDDEANALAVQPDGGFVACGVFHQLPVAPQSYTFINAGALSPGAVIRFTARGDIRSITRLGDVVDDCDVNPATGAIAAVGDFGLVQLAAAGDGVHWQLGLSAFNYTSSGLASGDAAEYSRGRRVAVGPQGSVAALFNEDYFVYSSQGQAISQRRITREDNNKQANPDGMGGYNHRVEDIAIDDGRGLVFPVGWSQRSSNFQSAFLAAYSLTQDGDDGQDALVWRSYNWWSSAASSTSLTADTRGLRLVRGPGGALLFSGNADGGNNIFTRATQYLAANACIDCAEGSSAINNVTIDRWNNGAGAGAGSYAYVAAINPDTGDAIAGQFQYSSSGVNNPGNFRVFGLAQAQDGRIWLGGWSGKPMPDRDTLTINGQPIGPRQDNESVLYGLAPGFTARLLVASFTGSELPASSEVTEVALSGSSLGVFGQTSGGLVTVSPLDSTREGQEAFFAVVQVAQAGLSVPVLDILMEE